MPKKADSPVVLYKVANPNGLQPGVALIQWRPPGADKELSWYEGDDFVPLPGMRIDRLIGGHYIVLVEKQHG